MSFYCQYAIHRESFGLRDHTIQQGFQLLLDDALQQAWCQSNPFSKALLLLTCGFASTLIVNVIAWMLFAGAFKDFPAPFLEKKNETLSNRKRPYVQAL